MKHKQVDRYTAELIIRNGTALGALMSLSQQVAEREEAARRLWFALPVSKQRRYLEDYPWLEDDDG